MKIVLRRSRWVFIGLLWLSQGFAQNLVPNPGFEAIEACPQSFGEIQKLKYWENYHYTPDFFHACTNSTYVNIPENFFGKQKPANGKGYAGITVYHKKYPNEVIGVKLLEPLKKGVSYEARIKVSLAEKYSRFAANNLGFVFTNTPHQAYNGKKVHVKAIDVISETKEWVTIGGVFTPEQNYQYMLIGNFFDHESTDRLEVHPQVEYPASYYYIDDVYVAKQGRRMSFSSSSKIEQGRVYRLDNVLFDFDQVILKPFSRIELLKLGEILQKNPTMTIQISGHTDDIGTHQNNLILSLKRAKAVTNFLLREMKINQKRLITKGLGETQPITSNATKEGRALNRRVEFSIFKK